MTEAHAAPRSPSRLARRTLVIALVMLVITATAAIAFSRGNTATKTKSGASSEISTGSRNGSSGSATTKARSSTTSAATGPVEGDGGPRAVTATNGPGTAISAPTLPMVGTPTTQLAPAVPAPSVALRADHRKDPRHLRLLVITPDENDPNYVAVRVALARLGVPADVLVTRDHQLTEDVLWDGQHTANYQGVIVASSELVYHDPASNTWQPTFSGTEITLLWAFEQAFGIRQASGDTFPDGAGGSYGLAMDDYVDVDVNTITTTLTDEGRKLFSYLNPAAQIPIQFARVYRAHPVDPNATTPLLVTGDGHAVASITKFKDGRENLALTASVSQDAMHWVLLADGIINWVSNGLFVGELHANLDVQLDDLFLIGAEWDAKADNAKTGLAYRISASDLDALQKWQAAERNNPLFSQLRLEWAFNGVGTTQPEVAALVSAVEATQSDWNFTNHTWAHRDLDALSYDDVVAALKPNIDLAVKLGFTNFSPDSMVQPNISGLENDQYLKAASDVGVRYIISDTSRPGWNNPSPNAGFYSQYAPKVLIVPRHTTTLFANVSTPDEWVSEYNSHYGPNGDMAVFDHNLTYAEILDRESDLMLKSLLDGDLDPWMFHQPNVRQVDGHTVLADLLDATFAKYAKLYNLPIRNMRLAEVGTEMASRMAFDGSGVDAVMTPCQSVVINVKSAATIPVTGLAAGPSPETYGPATISHLAVTPGQPLTVPAPACS